MKHLIKLKRNRLMESYACWLNQKAERFTPIKKKIGVVLFCVLSGSVSLYIIVSPMIGDPSHESRFLFHGHPFSNHIPGLIPGYIQSHIGKPSLPTDHPIISKKLYNRIEAFKNNDSLMKANPRLLDSIHAFEQLYQSQIKK